MAPDDVETKRVYGDRAGKSELLVAASLGVLAVDVSADRIGRFGVAHRCDPTDVAAAAGRVALATDQEVLLREPADDGFEATGFGPAVAVGFDGESPVAADPDGRVARLDLDDVGRADGEQAWTDLGRLDAAVRAIDGRLLAAADGVHRLPGLDYAGLDDARDVAAAGPLAATGGGLYSLGNGWMDEIAGDFRVATAGGETAHGATADALYERSPGGWDALDLPTEGPVVDVAYGDVTYAVTADGGLLAEGEDGWRSQALGVDGVVGCVLP